MDVRIMSYVWACICARYDVDMLHFITSFIGAVLATEMKNNAYKLARWTAEAILAGIDEIKLGYVDDASCVAC